MWANNSTEVRKNWSETVDFAVRKHPVLIKRNRDLLALINVKHLEKLLVEHHIYVTVEYTDKGIYTAKIPVFDIFVKADTITGISDNAVQKITEFCNIYFDDLDININLPERAILFPYVLKVIISQINNINIKDILIIKN